MVFTPATTTELIMTHALWAKDDCRQTTNNRGKGSGFESWGNCHYLYRLIETCPTALMSWLAGYTPGTCASAGYTVEKVDRGPDGFGQVVYWTK